MLKEINVMKARGIYDLVERLDSRNVIGSKWVFAPKFDSKRLVSD